VALRLLILLAVGLWGCAPTPWEKPGATPQELEADDHACETAAFQNGYLGSPVQSGATHGMNMKRYYEQCMTSKGYAPRT
jgi:hypothetical protein